METIYIFIDDETLTSDDIEAINTFDTSEG